MKYKIEYVQTVKGEFECDTMAQAAAYAALVAAQAPAGSLRVLSIYKEGYVEPTTPKPDKPTTPYTKNEVRALGLMANVTRLTDPPRIA